MSRDAPTSIPLYVGAEPPPPIAFADFFDGESAIAHRVEFELHDAARILEIRPPEAPALRWPFDTLRRLPDQADPTRIVLTSTERPLARLILRDDDAITISLTRLGKIDTRRPVRGKRRIAAWALGAMASVALIVFFLVPVMADQLARLLPPNGEQALGDATLGQIQSALAEDFAASVPLCTAPEGVAALAAMQARLGGDFDLPYDIDVTILDHAMVNAFALPGGRVVFFRGMIETATHPDQIAAVLAHEIGHVVARDPTRIALRSAGSLGVLGLLFGDFAGGAAVLFLVEQLIQADYTRDAEEAADDFGIRMLQAAKVNPAALGDLFEVIRAKYGDADGIVAHFMSHPSLGDRIEKARNATLPGQTTAPILSEAEWRALQSVCESG